MDAEFRAAIEVLVGEARRLETDLDLQHGIPYFDQRKDELIAGLPGYARALEGMGRLEYSSMYGDNRRMVLAFVYSLLSNNGDALDDDAFTQAWNDLWVDFTSDVWTFYSVANLQYFSGDSGLFELRDGVTIRHRAFEELRELLKWGGHELTVLTEDWMRGGGGSEYVILAKDERPKEPANLVLGGTGVGDTRILQMLLAARLHKPGAIGIGPIYHVRPSVLRLTGGMSSSLFDTPHFRSGGEYHFETTDCGAVNSLFSTLEEFNSSYASSTSNVTLALRRFSSSFERSFGQAQDLVVDAVIALEALLVPESDELAFRMAFRGSSILASEDIERRELFVTLRKYYGLRSRIVHGSSLTQAQVQTLQDTEPLRDILRRLLRAFLALTASTPLYRTGNGRGRFYKALDETLLDAAMRAVLQDTMGLSAEA